MMVLAVMSSDSQWSGTLPETNSDMVQLRNLGLAVLSNCLDVAHSLVLLCHLLLSSCGSNLQGLRFRCAWLCYLLLSCYGSNVQREMMYGFGVFGEQVLRLGRAWCFDSDMDRPIVIVPPDGTDM